MWLAVRVQRFRVGVSVSPFLKGGGGGWWGGSFMSEITRCTQGGSFITAAQNACVLSREGKSLEESCSCHFSSLCSLLEWGSPEAQEPSLGDPPPPPNSAVSLKGSPVKPVVE